MALQPAAFDASALILLAKIDLLQVVAREVEIHIPQVVKREALAKPHSYDAQLIDRMIRDGAIQLAAAVPASAVRLIQREFRLAQGEASALWVAQESQFVLGIDDGPGIRAAKILGVPFVTALQILVELAAQKRLDTASALRKLDSLLSWGRYGAQLAEDARAKIREEKDGLKCR
jgi:predicted nucleic acid-binding protein